MTDDLGVARIPGGRRAGRTIRRVATVLAGGALLFLAACSGVETKEASAGTENPITQRPYGPAEKDSGTILGDGLLFGGSDSKGGGGVTLPVNKYLWRATLDTISSLQFLTLVSTDPYGGVIITDWGVSPATPNEQLKVTAYITSAELKPQSLNVQVNRQTRDASGAWVVAPVSEQTAEQLEDAILTRARQLRIEAGDDEG